MKKIISYILLVALVFNVLAMNVFADTPISIEITGAESKSESENTGDVNIKITSTVGKDLLIKVLDVANNNKIIYLDTVLEDENNTPDGKITNVVLDKEDIGFKTYKVIASESTAAAEKEFKTTKYSGGGGGGGGGTSAPEPDPWVPVSGKTEEEKPDTGAHIDPIDGDGKNAGLWDYIGNVKSEKDATAAIEKITNVTDKTALNDETARNNVAVAGETMAANISAKSVKLGSGNKLYLTDSSINASDLGKLDKTMTAIENSIKNNKITLNRQMAKELILKVKFNNKSKATIAISKSLVEKLIAAGVDLLTIKDDDFKISYTITELKEMLGDKDEISFEIDKSGLVGDTKKIAVNFDTDKTQTVKIAFPGLNGNTKYMAIVDENGNPVGGRYNPATGVLEAKISESGVYQIVNNEKDFNDIKHLSEEMQESIKILAAKGIIEGTSVTEFSPENTISRAEVAALLLRVLSQVDPNADGGFADVKKSDWFYGTAGSAKSYGIIHGFDDNTFRGNLVIAKDQILAIASRVLQKEMKYITPEKPTDWLTFTDASSIADWAAKDIALASMANIITRTADNTIHATENMTRGDAALIIMRLFYKIW